ncbi:MAG: hypothetical protein ACO3C1_03680, partial [Ilumatobacteraceae bacterium]
GQIAGMTPRLFRLTFIMGKQFIQLLHHRCDFGRQHGIDPGDAHLVDEVRAAGIEPIVVPSVMSTPEIGAALARRTLEAAGVSPR